MTNPLGDVLFSWLHLSDIHIGHGDTAHGWDQQLVLQALHDDAAALIREESVPRPQVVFVTGDISFSGATRQIDEYSDARRWLLSIASVAKLSQADVFIIPGNHDIQRSADKYDKNVGRLVNDLRSGEAPLDDSLREHADAALLEKRLANYLAFAKGFAPECRADAEVRANSLFWRHHLTVGGGLRVRIAGLNTAILARDDDDRSRLRVGNAQLALALIDPMPTDSYVVVMVLSHHPFQGGWLADEGDASNWVRNHAHIHLSGHTHAAQANQTVSGGGRSFIRVTAGASHGEMDKGRAQPSHGYNFGALVGSPGGKVQVALWPRRWSQDNADFRRDSNHVPDNRDYSLHPIAGVTVPVSAHTKASALKTKAVVFDFDGTLSHSLDRRTTWDKIWVALGYTIQDCADLHTRFQQGKLTHQQWCDKTRDAFRERRLTADRLKSIAADVALVQGTREVIGALRDKGVRLFILSGSIKSLIRDVLADLQNDFEEIKANELVFDPAGIISGINGTPFDFEGKAVYLNRILKDWEYLPQEVLFVGNSRNDIFARQSGVATLCVNPWLTDPANEEHWTYAIPEMAHLKEILGYVNL